MTLHLLLGQRLDTPRKLRFPGRFLDDIAALVGSVGLEVITRVHKVKGRGLSEGRGSREDVEPASQAGAAILPWATWLRDHKAHLQDRPVPSASIS